MAAFEVIALDTATPQLRAPGASDTYTFPRAVEMPLGTANGVLYLNGSKVVTSGSGLTFDGNRILNITPATATSSIQLVLNHGGGTTYFATDSSTGANFGAAYAGAFWNSGNYPWLWAINGSEQMRLTSTGLGIGTSSPDTKLDVVVSAGLAAVFGSESASNSYVGFKYNSTTLGYVGNGAGVAVGSASTDFSIGSTGARALTFGTNDTERMRLDVSGNLGLGVTPSAWTGSGGKNIEIGAAGNALFGSASLTSYISNANFDSSWKYSRTGFASRYEQQDSNHRWYTAPSGTAGNAISFTQAMTLDASGNLGIGSTSPVGYSGYLGITVQATNGGFINLRNGTLSHQMEIAVESGGGTGYVKTVTASPLILGANNTEKLRVKPTGQLRFVPLSSDPAGAEAGDVYYNSSTNKLRVYNGTAWVDLH